MLTDPTLDDTADMKRTTVGSQEWLPLAMRKLALVLADEDVRDASAKSATVTSSTAPSSSSSDMFTAFSSVERALAGVLVDRKRTAQEGHDQSMTALRSMIESTQSACDKLHSHLIDDAETTTDDAPLVITPAALTTAQREIKDLSNQLQPAVREATAMVAHCTESRGDDVRAFIERYIVHEE